MARKKQSPEERKRKISEACRRWKILNKERVKEINKAWYEKNKELVKELSKKRYAKNRERLREESRERYSLNKRGCRERRRQYYLNNKEKYIARNRKFRDQVLTIMEIEKNSTPQERESMKKMREEIFELLKRSKKDLSTEDKRREFAMSILEW